MNLLQGQFQEFDKLSSEFSKVLFTEDYKNFAVEEFKRFRSLAGTTLANIDTMPRDFSHLILRSILESFFWLIYIFDGSERAIWSQRFEEYMNAFKTEYYKLYNEPNLPRKEELEAPLDHWRRLPRSRDVKSLLTALTTIRGEKLDYLYFTYRVTSFDTHGRALKTLFSSAFQKDCNFPLLNSETTINLIADSYLVIWSQINS